MTIDFNIVRVDGGAGKLGLLRENVLHHILKNKRQVH
jgi:hypothetical protein